MKTFFRNLRLPLKREEKDVLAFLDGHFSRFDNELDALINARSDNSVFNEQIYAELIEKRVTIKGFCKSIIDSLEFYRNGKILEAHCTFESIMNDLQDSLVSSDIRGHGILNRYFRIRPDKGDERKDLFHIPFDEVTKVKAYRFSVAGFPCLYLSGGPAGLSLSWFECGMPDKFYWSEFKLDNGVAPLYLIDLTLSPFVSALNSQRLITSTLNQMPIKDFIVRMILSYPLMAACSLSVSNKNQNFIPEYIIPQMLLGWIRKSDKFRGVAYFTCSSSKQVKLYNAFNIALPPSNATNKGHCERLKNEFKLSQPRLVDLSDIFKDLSQNYEKIKNYRDWLEEAFQNELAIETIREIISVCDSFLQLFKKIRDKKMRDIEWAYQYIETLSLVSQRIKEDKYRELMIEQARLFSYDTDHSIRLCSTILDEFKSIQDLTNDFRDFDIKYFDISSSVFCFID